LLEHGPRAGRKILISGGGRCNFTNRDATAAHYLSANPHFAKSALARFTARHFLERVEQANVPYHEKTLGQLFCDRSAHDILTMLETNARDAGVELCVETRIDGVTKKDGFALDTSRGAFLADRLVVATGGLSVPKLGATDFGYRVARQFGLNIIPPRPALVPLVLDPAGREAWCDLAGVSCTVEVAAGKTRFRERMLFTHRGLSGPAILQISTYWKPGEHISIQPSATVPRRLAERWAGVEMPWTVRPAGTEGFAKAEVTGGGVDTGELDSKTMEARRVPGLYFIGEVVDVTGWLGGYNFQWAWSSGFAGGQAV
jgi:predicted Rossmann fold flavoprotein